MAPEPITEASRQVLTIARPQAGETLDIAIVPGSGISLGFEPGEAAMAREGNSLIFEFDDGSKVALNGFFAVGDAPLPEFRLPDGAVVAGLDFFAGSDLDVSTTAPGIPGAPGGGLNAYNDDPGIFLVGVDRLDKLGTFYWDGGNEVAREDQAETPFTVFSEPEPEPEGPSVSSLEVTVKEQDLLLGEGILIADGRFMPNFGSGGPNDATPVAWVQEAVRTALQDYQAFIDSEPYTLIVDFSTDGTSFTAYANGQEVLIGTLSFDAQTGEVSSTYTQKLPLQHGEQDSLTDEAIELELPYVVTNGNSLSATGSLTVHVLDDTPSAVPDAVSDIAVSVESLTLDFRSKNAAEHPDVTMSVSGEANYTDNGLGVLDEREADYRGTEYAQQISYHQAVGDGDEEYADTVTFDLADGKLADGLTFTVTNLVKDENETGVVYFYQEGELVGYAEFSSKTTVSMYNADGKLWDNDQDGGVSYEITYKGSNIFIITISGITYDKVEFSAIVDPEHVDLTDHPYDDSDYYLQQVTFAITSEAETSGSLGSFGADGPHAQTPSVFTDEPDQISGVLFNGEASILTFSLNDDGQSIVGKIGDETVLTLEINPEDPSQYTYTLYKDFLLPEGQSSIEIPYTLTDADGDTSSSSLTINLPADTTPELPEYGLSLAGLMPSLRVTQDLSGLEDLLGQGDIGANTSSGDTPGEDFQAVDNHIDQAAQHELSAEVIKAMIALQNG